MTSLQVQNARQSVPRLGGEDFWLRVELAADLESHLVVIGWSSEQQEFDLFVDDEPTPVTCLGVDRPDVAQALDLESGEGLGFVLVADYDGGATVELAWRDGGDVRVPLVLSDIHAETTTALHAEPRRAQALREALPPLSAAWMWLVSGVEGLPGDGQRALGNLERAQYSAASGLSFIGGWRLADPARTPLWIEATSGTRKSLDDAHFRARADVTAAYPGPLSVAAGDSGFVVLMEGLQVGDRIRLRAYSDGDILELGHQVVSALPMDQLGAAEIVFAYSPPGKEAFHEYISDVAVPLLSSVVEAQSLKGEDVAPTVWSFGEAPESPLVSVVVPLYGRLDFVEPQLLEFSRDSWFRKNVELLYVIDDPKLVDASAAQLPVLQEIYGVPFTVVWGGINRGFSGANNLGASVAGADRLLFLNSDVFPHGPGWLETLVDALDSDSTVGAVAPRLVFADGSIQHAGIGFRWRSDLGIWTNHHPHMGLDPTLDPAGSTDTEADAVTGACLLMGRSDFELVGGWDEGYLIGDFEDSDLCLKLRSAGRKILYTPRAELTHLERQSFASLGDGTFRQKVVIYNALRHQARWREMMESGHVR